MGPETIPVLAVFSTISWVAWLLFSSIRRYKVAQLQADIQGRLLQRFDSPDALLGYTQSDAGRQFIKSMDIERSTPYSQILKGVQAGIVFIFFGAGLLRLHAWNIGDEGRLSSVRLPSLWVSDSVLLRPSHTSSRAPSVS